MMFSRSFGPLATKAVLLGAASLALLAPMTAQAADLVVHGTVLRVDDAKGSVHTFRILVQETKKERDVHTDAKTEFVWSGGGKASYSDVKVKRFVEVRGKEVTGGAIAASHVAIRK